MAQVNQDLCIGCGACAAVCPNAFRINEEIGKAEATGESAECTQSAAEGCPVQAISV